MTQIPKTAADKNAAAWSTTSAVNEVPRKKKSSHSRRLASEPPTMDIFFASSFGGEFLEEEAEATLVTVLEERRIRAASEDNWRPAVPGERPPLARVGSYHPFDIDTDQEDTTLADLSLKIRAMKAAGKLMESSTKKNEDDRIFDRVGGNRDIGKSKVAATHTNADRLISNAMAVDKVFSPSEISTTDTDTDTASRMSSSFANTNEELLPLTASKNDSRESRTKWFCCGLRKKSGFNKKVKKSRKHSRFWCFRRNAGLGEVLNPAALARGFFRFITASYFAVIGVPAALLALFLYYFMGDPDFDILPGNATLAWWLLFLSKQTFMLELAIYIEFFLVDGLALRSKWSVKFLGPLFTLSIIQAKGWPFLTVCWALLDISFLHGDGWLFWTDIQLIKDDSGAAIMASAQYLRILLAVLFSGLAHAIKRTTVAMYFGKKTFINYKARLEKLLADIVLITEVAELAAEIQSISKRDENRSGMELQAKGRPSVGESKWGSMKFKPRNTSVNRGVTFKTDFRKTSSSDNDEEGIELEGKDEDLTDDDSSGSDVSDDERTSDGSCEEKVGSENVGATCELLMKNNASTANTTYSNKPAPTDEQIQMQTESASGFAVPVNVDFEGTNEGSTTIGSHKMLNFLERWIEPVNKLDTQVNDASIGDILKFRKALTYMDETHPFSECFGPANTRNACIRSSQKIYRHLLKAKKSAVLDFDVLALLAIDEDGNEIEPKRRAIYQLFRPDRNNELSLIVFVQSCDTVYKRLRFFRAAVGNASVIDKVLEGIIDSVFNFILLLVILSMLQFNPWALLVSISTLLVSLAFAVGPSTARYIEGVLLIAVRRPYDLGDRVLIVNAENAVNQGVGLSWFVEDINLFSTTLRFAATNEVSTVNNGAISLCRIVNYARSPRALVTIPLKFMINTEDAVISVFKAALEKFVKDRPRKWEGINHFRCESIETDLDLIEYSVRLRSTRTWQDAPGILNSQGELIKFCMQLGKQLGINYVSPNKRLRIFTTNEDALHTIDGKSQRSQTEGNRDLLDAAGNTVFEE